jgi:UDP-glucose 4-epimerase
MAIFVTGGAGYIGSHMVYELADAGERVVVLDNLSTDFDWAVAEGVPLIVGNTGDQNLVVEIIREHKVDSIVALISAISTSVPPLWNVGRTTTFHSCGAACAVAVIGGRLPQATN